MGPVSLAGGGFSSAGPRGLGRPVELYPPFGGAGLYRYAAPPRGRRGCIDMRLRRVGATSPHGPADALRQSPPCPLPLQRRRQHGPVRMAPPPTTPPPPPPDRRHSPP